MTDRPNPFLGSYPTTRMRRNRRDDWTRRLVAENKLSVDDLIWPIFVHDGEDSRIPVPSLPGIDRLSIGQLVTDVGEAKALGIPLVAIFPVVDPALKTDDAEEAHNCENLPRGQVGERSPPRYGDHVRCCARPVYQPWP